MLQSFKMLALVAVAGLVPVIAHAEDGGIIIKGAGDARPAVVQPVLALDGAPGAGNGDGGTGTISPRLAGGPTGGVGDGGGGTINPHRAAPMIDHYALNSKV